MFVYKVFENDTCELDPNAEQDFDEQNKNIKLHYIYEDLNCDKYFVAKNFEMTSNGELRIDKFTYAIDDYCIMDMKNGSKLAHICVIGNNLGSNTLTLFQDISSRILVISMIISSMFLVLSFVIGK